MSAGPQPALRTGGALRAPKVEPRPPSSNDSALRQPSGKSPTYLLSSLLPLARGAVALLLYCLRCAPRGTRGTRSAPVPQLHGAWRLPQRRLSSSRSSSSRPRLGLSVGAAQPNSVAASLAGGARSIPRPTVLTRIPALRGGARSRLPSASESLRPASGRCQSQLSTALSALPPPVASPGAGAALPMRLGGCAVPAQSLYREEEGERSREGALGPAVAARLAFCARTGGGHRVRASPRVQLGGGKALFPVSP